MLLDLAFEVSTSISDIKEGPGPDEATHIHREKEKESQGSLAHVQEDVSLVSLSVRQISWFVSFVILVAIDESDQWVSDLSERSSGDEGDNAENHKDGVCLDGVSPHEWRLEANSLLNFSVSVLELYPNVGGERD